MVRSEVRVLFDAHWWCDGPPSGRGILRAAILTWLHDYPDDSLVLRAPRADLPRIRADLAAEGLAVELRPVGRWARVPALTALTSSARSVRADAVVTQNFTALGGGGVKAAFVYDALFTDHPEWFTRGERLYFSLITASSRRADVVIANTDVERQRMLRAWPWLRGRITVAPVPVPRGLARAAPVRPAIVPEVAGEFILSVGRLNARKNLAHLVDGFLASRRSASTTLYIVGSADGLTSDFLSGRDHGGRVVPTGSLSDGELRWMYENSGLFVFPSLAEGFGMPLVEAASFGAPSIASDIAPFREIGLSQSYFDPTSIAAIADAIDGAVLRSAAPPQTPAQFTWSSFVSTVRSRILEVSAGG